MKCLVTGGAGFIGSNLIKRLLEGYDNRITSLDNYTTGNIENQHKGCKYIHGDIRDYKALGNFDIIFHMAALPRIGPSFKNPKEVFETNVQGTQNILEYARVYNIPVIYAGSSSFHGGRYKNHIHLQNGKVKSYVKCIVIYLEYQLQYVDFIMCMVTI